MQPDTAENRIKMVEDLLWQRITATKVKNKRTASIRIDKDHRSDSKMTSNQFHDALMSVVDSSNGLSSSCLTEDEEFLKYDTGWLSTEPHLYVVKVRPSWRDEYRKRHLTSASTSQKNTKLLATKLVATYKDIELYDNNDIKCRGVLLPIKGVQKDILILLITQAPHVCSFNTIKTEAGIDVENNTILKYRWEIQKKLDKVGILNAIHPHQGEGLKLKY